MLELVTKIYLFKKKTLLLSLLRKRPQNGRSKQKQKFYICCAWMYTFYIVYEEVKSDDFDICKTTNKT